MDGRILYVREALGLNGLPIKIYKFRTMEIGANEKRLEVIASQGMDMLGKPINDPRITSLGRILRRYWIDELPQLYSLIRGDLKLVGVRPKDEVCWSIYPQELKTRALKQKPGLFGITYSFSQDCDFEESISKIYTYLDEWEREPEQTDKIYFSKILNNIVLNGIRSC